MELTKNDIQIFLQRTTVQGLEVPTYIQLTSKLETMLNTPEKEVQNE